MKFNNKLEAFVTEFCTPKTNEYKLTAKKLIEKIKSGNFFGLVMVDIHTPEHLKNYFETFTPIYKNVDVCLQEAGPMMTEYAVRNGLSTTPRRCLINSYFARHQLFSSELLQFYLNKGNCQRYVTNYV